MEGSAFVQHAMQLNVPIPPLDEDIGREVGTINKQLEELSEPL